MPRRNRLNPDGEEVDTNPQSVDAHSGRQRVIADAGGNSLLAVDDYGDVDTLAVFPRRAVPSPFPGGGDFRMSAVPTTVVRGADGAYYVGQLTGFPFPAGAANVYRVRPGEDVEVFASGFTTILDLAFGDDGELYVLQATTNGLASPDPGPGRLFEIDAAGERRELAAGELGFATGLAVDGRGDLWISNNGSQPATGEVLRLRDPTR